MADWIHCNSCFNQPKNSDSNYVLTSCGHIFCSKCETTDVVNQCKVCKTPCVVTKLTPNLTPDVRSYFEDTEELLKKVCNTIKFQKGHRLSLLKAHRKTMEKYHAAKIHIRKVEHENALLKRKLESYEKSKISSSPQTNRMFQFTPNSQRTNNTSFFNSATSQKSGQMSQRNKTFREPNLLVYQQYRNTIQGTPYDESPSERTPAHFSASQNRRYHAAEQRIKSRLPIKTPPYDDFKVMNITSGRANK